MAEPRDWAAILESELGGMVAAGRPQAQLQQTSHHPMGIGPRRANRFPRAHHPIHQLALSSTRPSISSPVHQSPGAHRITLRFSRNPGSGAEMLQHMPSIYLFNVRNVLLKRPESFARTIRPVSTVLANGPAVERSAGTRVPPRPLSSSGEAAMLRSCLTSLNKPL